MTNQFTCIKCGNHDYEKDEISTNGGALSRFFDVSNKRFIAFSCTNCGYTELFKRSASGLSNFIDFIGSN